MRLGDGEDDIRREHGFVLVRTTDAGGAPTAAAADGGERESASGGTSGRGRRFRVRLSPCGVGDRAAPGAQIGSGG